MAVRNVFLKKLLLTGSDSISSTCTVKNINKMVGDTKFTHGAFLQHEEH